MAQHSRRDFLKTTSAAALGMLGTFQGDPLGRAVPEIDRRSLPTQGDPFFRDLALRALDVAKSGGASYADVRIRGGKERRTDVRDRRVETVRVNNERQIGVRVLVNGAWGFTTSTELTRDEVARVTLVAVKQAKANPYGKANRIELAPCPVVPNGVWETPIQSDPFKKDVNDQLAVQLAASEAALKLNLPGVLIRSRFAFSVSEHCFASSEGTWIVQTIRRFGGWYTLSTFSADNQYGTLLTPESFQTGGYGWEAIENARFTEEAPRLAERAVAMMAKPRPVLPGRYDVVLDGRAMTGVLAPSVGRALHMDRVFGYEMNEGGTSYLSPPEKILGQSTFENPLLTLRGSRSVPHANATVKWDEEGVSPDDFTLVKNGAVVDYMTTREFAAKLAWWYKQKDMPVRSHGCAAAAAPGQSQVVIDPTLIMEPAAKDTSVEELIGDVKKGLYFTEALFVQMDPSLLNMETRTFTPVYEIRNGKLGGMVQHAGIIARTPDFWKAMDGVGGKQTQVMHAHVVTKGDPPFQVSREALCPAGRFRQMSIAGFTRKA